MRLESDLDLIIQWLQGLYDAENQLTLALPRVAARATNPALQAALRSHLEETRTHATRLETIAHTLGLACAGRKCPGMQGLLKEGEQAMNYGGSPELIDLAIMTSAQAIEQFEIAQYQALASLCERAGLLDACEMLELTIDEEQNASQTLADVANAALGNEPVPISPSPVGDAHSHKGPMP